MAFGEARRFKNRSHEPIGGISDGRRFYAGICGGVDRRTDMLPDGDSIKMARTVFRIPSAEKWNKESMAKIGCTPYVLHQPREPEMMFRAKIEESKEQPKVVLFR